VNGVYEEPEVRTVNERMTSRMDEGFVVFLFGMRMNRWWQP
jgi:hypothetical protein